MPFEDTPKPEKKLPPGPVRKVSERGALAQDVRDGEIIELWLTGETQHAIAARFGVTRSAVYASLARTKRAWREWRLDVVDIRVQAELARLDRIESEAWDAWERSKKSVTETTDREGTTENGFFSEHRKKRYKRDGSATFLDTAMRCVEMRLKVIGAFDAAKIEMLKLMEQDKQNAKPKGVLVVVETPEQANELMAYEDWDAAVVEGEVLGSEDEDVEQ